MKPVEIEPKDKHIADMLEFVRDGHSVELKLTVQDTDRHSAINSLGMDVLDAELRQAVFFDTPDLKLNRRGIVVRARRMPKGGDTTIKLRPVVPAELPRELHQSASFKLEVDAMPGSVVCSGSLKARADNSEVKQVLRDERSTLKLFSREQRNFYKKHAPKGISLDSLTAFGPINIAKLKWTPPGFTSFLVAEMWFYPDGTRLLELSIKCKANEAFHVLAEARIFLLKRGISLTGAQEMKTRKALEYFSRMHKGKRGAIAA